MCDFFAAHTSRTCVVNGTVEAVTVVSSLMRAQYLGGDFVRCLVASVGTPHDADLQWTNVCRCWAKTRRMRTSKT